jgi:hypothetical protein
MGRGLILSIYISVISLERLSEITKNLRAPAFG